jgi:hypothetical protein
MYQVSKEDRDRFKLWLKEYCDNGQKNLGNGKRAMQKGNDIPEELRRLPCKGCGSPFHGLLEYQPIVQKHRFKCPNRLGNGNGAFEWYDEKRIPYQLCPEQLAKENGHDKDKVRRAMNRYEQLGAGRFKPPEANKTLRMKALEACDEYQKNTQRRQDDQVQYRRGNCPAKIIGIEGWGRPDQRRRDQDDVSLKVGISREENPKVKKEIQRMLVVVSLAILTILLIHASLMVSELTSKEYDSRNQGHLG